MSPIFRPINFLGVNSDIIRITFGFSDTTVYLCDILHIGYRHVIGESVIMIPIKSVVIYVFANSYHLVTERYIEIVRDQLEVFVMVIIGPITLRIPEGHAFQIQFDSSHSHRQ